MCTLLTKSHLVNEYTSHLQNTSSSMLTGFTSADMQHLVYNMNVPQSPFGGFMQPVQSPPYGSQFQTASATPPWANEIIEDLKCIKISVSKNDKIEKIVDGINTKVETLETKVKNNDAIVTEVEQSNQFISNGFEEQRKY